MPGRIILVVFAVLYVALVWGVRYVPTQDGPSHLANAAALRDILLPGEQGLEARYYVRARPVPNWAYYAVVAPLMIFVPPLVAEKLFLSFYILSFVFAYYRLARAAGVRTYAPAVAALPFSVALPFQMGFFNYSLGVAVMLGALAYFWRRRDRLGVKAVVVLNLFAAAAYFCHLLAALLLLGSIYLLNVFMAAGVVPASRSLRRRALFLGGLLPAWILPIYYLSTPTGGDTFWLAAKDLAPLLLRGWPLVTLASGQRPVGFLAVAIALAAAVATFVAIKSGRRPWPGPRDAFGLLAVAFLVLCFAAPDAAAGGSAVSARLAVLFFLFVFIWGGDGFGKRGDAAALVLAATFAGAAWGGNFYYYRQFDRVLREFNEADYEFRPGAGMAYFDFSDARPGRVRATFHAGAYYALRARLYNLCNYEADLPYFPIRFRDDGSRPPAVDIIGGYLYDAEECKSLVDYIIVWDMEPYHRKRLAAERFYDLVVDGPRLKIFEIRPGYRKAGR
ncbi:MAG: hypothetical protein GTN49_11640 [candidate division Zixibacteria bacterium]|nr:hypothetical protein [candidate division Zixibacteria bacterium]